MERTRKVQQQVNELFAPKFWELIDNNKSKLLDWFLLSSNPTITWNLILNNPEERWN